MVALARRATHRFTSDVRCARGSALSIKSVTPRPPAPRLLPLIPHEATSATDDEAEEEEEVEERRTSEAIAMHASKRTAAVFQRLAMFKGARLPCESAASRQRLRTALGLRRGEERRGEREEERTGHETR